MKGIFEQRTHIICAYRPRAIDRRFGCDPCRFIQICVRNTNVFQRDRCFDGVRKLEQAKRSIIDPHGVSRLARPFRRSRGIERNAVRQQDSVCFRMRRIETTTKGMA